MNRIIGKFNVHIQICLKVRIASEKVTLPGAIWRQSAFGNNSSLC